MSAFVVSRATMDRAVEGLLTKKHHRPIIGSILGVDTSAPDAGTEIGRRLFTVNIAAVTYRYPDVEDNPDDMPGEGGCAAYPATYQYVPPSRPQQVSDLIASIKALQCLDYQCSEGDVHGHASRMELEAATKTLALHAIEQTPEYDAAEWDA
jgi:hypothetical protein